MANQVFSRNVRSGGAGDGRFSPNAPDGAMAGGAAPLLLGAFFALFSGGLLFSLSRSDDGGLQVFLLALMVVPALILAATGSRWQVPYLMCLWAFAPEVRRVVDWLGGEYQTVTVLSLTPLLGTLTLLIPVWRRGVRLTPIVRGAACCLTAAYLYGGVVGMARNNVFTAAYELATYAVPLLIVLYAASRPLDARERDLWLRSLSVITVIVAAYGWYQVITVPPWDAFWIVNGGMVAGQPLPFKFRMFSTLNSAGPAAGFLALALGPMLLERRWRGVFGWAGVLLVASALAFAQVRSAWLMAGVLICVYILYSSGARRVSAAAAVLAAGTALFFLGPFLPGWDMVAARAATLQNVQEDGSFQGRVASSEVAASSILSNPLGSGMGYAGNATKLTNSSALRRDAADTTETGFLSILQALGVIGGGLFFTAVALCFVAVRRVAAAAAASRAPLLRTHGEAAKNKRAAPAAVGTENFAQLARAGLVCCLVTLLFGNALPGVTGFLFWFLFALVIARPVSAPRPEANISP